ncbi:MAG: 3-dehydroquinate synthase [Bacteroidota bacterium]|nr:3-dehydroquinate synthase [Bacteroidota bacterium]
MNKTISAGRHDILFTNEAGRQLDTLLLDFPVPFSGIYVVCDQNTKTHCLPLINDYLHGVFHEIIIGTGELQKNLKSCETAWDQLLKAGADRDALVINLGGGMISDLGGFVASTYKRGIRFINIPTSLLGMVDASAGGKTGVDLNHYKNMIGTFSFPEKVIIDPVFLNTLPEKEWKNGMAEMLKHGLIADTEIWSSLKDQVKENSGDVINATLKKSIISILEKAVSVKATIVAADPFEKKERLYLNFGHTIGHALETFSLAHDHIPLSHGEAIATGMICESFISGKISGLSEAALQEISEVFSGFFPHRIIRNAAVQEVAQLIKADKKAEAGKIRFVLISAIGNPVMNNDVSTDLIVDALHFYNSLCK